MPGRNVKVSYGADTLMLSPEDFHAKTSAHAEKAKGLMGLGLDCGVSKKESFAKLNRESLLWKTAQCSLFEDLELSLETWPEWGLMSGGECFELRPLERHTIERGFS